MAPLTLSLKDSFCCLSIFSFIPFHCNGFSQTINQKGYLMYKSNVTEQVNGAVNQIDTMLFVAHTYILRESFEPISR